MFSAHVVVNVGGLSVRSSVVLENSFIETPDGLLETVRSNGLVRNGFVRNRETAREATHEPCSSSTAGYSTVLSAYLTASRKPRWKTLDP